MEVGFAKGVPLAYAENFPVAAFTNPLEYLETSGAMHKASWRGLKPFRKEVIFNHSGAGAVVVG